METEICFFQPEDDPLFRQKGIAFAVVWTLMIFLAAYTQYR